MQKHSRHGVKDSSRMSLADFAQVVGVHRTAIQKQVRRHGVLAGTDGLYSVDELHAARLAGAAMDKAALSRAAAKAPVCSLQRAKLDAQVRKLGVEISLLEAERDKAIGKLVDLEWVNTRSARRYAELASRIVTWREAECAKRPELAQSIEACAASLTDLLCAPLESARQ